MSTHLPPHLLDLALGVFPVPIADAVGALAAAEGVFEQRDRVVEVFRALMRLDAALALATRLQFGPGPGGEGEEVQRLVRALRSRGLTDGQWVGLVRELLRPWVGGGHPVPELVAMFHRRGSKLGRCLDGLLEMRKIETVAHGSSGDEEEVRAVLERRVPQLQALLELHAPLWERLHLVAPLARPSDGLVQRAWRLVGYTPGRGRWRLTELAPGQDLPPGELLVVGAGGNPVLALHPVAILRRPSPEAVEELFFLDGSDRRGARFVAVPSMATHREQEVWASLERAFDGLADEEVAQVAGQRRPFRGLMSFGIEQAELFFGRSEQALSLANRIRRHPLVTVTGPSGSGKSSLVQAGVLPLLEDLDAIVLRPGARPDAILLERLAHLAGVSCAESPAALAVQLRAWCRQLDRRLVLLLDQAEELFTLCDLDERRQACGVFLAALAADPEGPVRVVLAIREDFFARLATLHALRSLYDRNVEVVTAPGPAALASTVVEPARLFGYTPEDPELVQAMVQEVTGEPAALALLQFCSDRLWEQRDRHWKRLTWEAYRSMGGVVGALATHAEALYAKLTAGQQSAARELLLALVTAERTRASVPRGELMALAVDAGAASLVIERLLQERLLVTREAGGGDGAVLVELVHETLVGHWQRLTRWLDEDREGTRLRQALGAAAREWEARGRSDGLLWSGDALAELRVWIGRSEQRLTDRDRDFFDRSVQVERSGKLRRRTITVAVVAGSLSLASVALWSWRGAEQARIELEFAVVEATQATAAAERGALFAMALGPGAQRDPSHRAALLRAAMQMDGPERWTEAAARLERLALEDGLSLVLPGEGGAIADMALTSDGELVAAVYEADNKARLWRLEDGALLQEHPANRGSELLFTPAGDALLLCCPDERLSVISTADGSTIQVIEKVEGQAALIPSGTRLAARTRGGIGIWERSGPSFQLRHSLAVANVSGLIWLDDQRVAARSLHHGQAPSEIVWWDAGSGEMIMSVPGTFSGGASFHAALRGDLVLSAGGWQDLSIFSTQDGSLQHTLAGFEQGFSHVAVSEDGSALAVASRDAFVRTWDLTAGAPQHSLEHWGSVRTTAYSRDGAQLASGTIDAAGTWLWDAQTGRLLKHLWGHHDEVTQLGFTPDGQGLVAGALSGEIRRWSTAPTRVRAATDSAGFSYPVPSADRALVLREGPSLEVVDVATDRRVALLEPPETPGHEDPLETLAGPDDGRLVLFLGAEGAYLADVTADAPRWRRLAFRPQGRKAIAWSPEGDRVVLENREGELELWALDGEAPLEVLPSLEGERALLVVGPGARDMLVAARQVEPTPYRGEDGTSYVLNIIQHPIRLVHDGGRRLGEQLWSNHTPKEAWFSRGGALLAIPFSIGNTHRLHLHDAATGELVHRLEGFTGQVTKVVFSHDDSALFLGTRASTVEHWSLDSGERIASWLAPSDGVWFMALSPDGTRLATHSGSGHARVRIWDIATQAVLLEADSGASILGFNADGSRLMGVCRSGLVESWSSRAPDPEALFLETGAATNLRVCRESREVVAVVPYPGPETAWAPAELCGE
jgi:WD40 repeat protein